jgi:hypothetical protein
LALEELKKDPYIKIIPLYYFENLTYEQIAEKLNCCTKTVFRNKQRLLEYLKEIMEDYKNSGLPYNVEQRDIERKYGTCGEQGVKLVLQKLGIKYKQQATFEGCGNKHKLRFDFSILDDSVVIEYQGIQHYEPVKYFGGEQQFKYTKKLDNLKRIFCEKYNILLIEIPYWETEIEKLIIEKISNVHSVSLK